MRILRFAVPVVVAAGMLLTGTSDASAQKKKTTPTKPSTSTQQTPAQQTPAPQTPPSATMPRMGNSLKDFLSKFKGELTTLGVLRQVEADYFTVEEEGTTLVYPMSTVRYIKVIKPEARADEEEGEEEEGEPEAKPTLEIRLQ